MALALAAVVLGPASPRAAQDTTVTYPGGAGPGRGKHIVFLTGDEEYRGEEGLPMLAKILSRRHGFKATVLFALDPDGTINPKNTSSLPGSEALDTADAIVMLLRFRNWPEADMRRFEARLNAGVPIVAMRTSTHAFNGFPKGSPWESWNYNNAGGFGKRVLGETWLTHWGRHKIEATRGVIEPGQQSNPILRGVTDLFGDTDVYEAYPPADATVLVRGLVLQSLDPASAPATPRKARPTDKQEQGINDRRCRSSERARTPTPTARRIACSRRRWALQWICRTKACAVSSSMVCNMGLGLDVPSKADVTYVGAYTPTAYGFDGFQKGLKPSDFVIK